jgi:hypothetical protein
MNLESWNAVFQWGSVAPIAVTFFIGAGALVTGNRINERQSERLVTLEKELASAKITLAEQQERAANAERALLGLQERARPRSIDPNARNLMISALELGSPSKSVSIMFVGGSVREPRDFAEQIRDMLTQAGWTITSFDGGPSLGAPPIGLTVRVPDMTGDVGTAAVLVDAFNRGGLNAAVVRDTRMTTPGDVRIMVGLKP